MKRKNYLLIAAFIYCSGLFAQILDQSNTATTNSGWLVSPTNNQTIGQSFTAGTNGDLDNVTISLNTTNSTYPIIAGAFSLTIYNGAGYTGSVLGVENFNVAASVAAGDFSIPITSTMTLVTGNSYTYVIRQTDNTGQIMVNGSADTYIGGQAYTSILNWAATAHATYDFKFKIYLKACITDQTVTATNPTLCANNTGTTITTGSSENGINYYLRDDANDTIVDGPITGTGSGISLNTGNISSTMTYNVYAEKMSPTTTNALAFTGNSGLKKVSLGTDLWDDNFVGNNQITVEAWVKRSSTGSLHTIISNYDGTYPLLFRMDNNKIRFSVNSQGGALSSSTIPVGVWVHLAGTYDGATTKVYINGVLEGTQVNSGNLSASTNEVKIGGGLSSNNTEYFLGDIADVRMWNVTKTGTEIAASMNIVLAGTETGLIANYQFTEGSGTTAANSVAGNLYPGTLINSPAWVAGPNLTSVDCTLEMTTLPTVTVLPALTGNNNTTICATGSVTINGNVYDATTPTGTEVFTNVGTNNCDSTVTIALNVLPALTGNNNTTICATGSVTINGNVYDATTPTGTEVFTNVGANGCDSTVTIALNVLPALTGNNNTTICATGSVTINGNVYDATTPTGTEVFTNVGANGCDSTVTIALNVLPAIDVTTTTASNTITANESGATYRWLDCNNSMSVIGGETNQSFTATTNGDYAAEITVGSCVDTSACVNITITGINENSFGSVVTLYPNPATGNVSLNFGKALNNGSVIIADITGKQVYSIDKLNSQVLNLDINHFSKGVYFVKIQHNNQQKVIKLIKQ